MIINTTSRNLEAKKKRGLVLQVAASLTQHFTTTKPPRWLNELLTGHHQRVYDGMGMNKHIFQALLRKLIRHDLHIQDKNFIGKSN